MPDWLSKLLEQYGPILAAGIVALIVAELAARASKKKADADRITNEEKAAALITDTWKDERDQRRDTQKEIKELRSEFQDYKEKALENEVKKNDQITSLQRQIDILEAARIKEAETLQRVGKKLRIMSSQKSSLQEQYNQAIADCAAKDVIIANLTAQLKAEVEATSVSDSRGDTARA